MKHNEMMNAMVELERAINKAHQIAENEFLFSNKHDDNSTFWFNTMYLLEAMTKMKCTIDIHPNNY